MASQGQRHIRQALQDAPQLHSFIISNVRPTGRQLGGGSYGTVEELEIDGLVCAGKKLYDALMNTENQDVQCMVDKYYNECNLLSDLRHPHIVQFLGICFLPDSRLPVLVMERLQCSLDELLENTADIPLSTKISILQDVARGLVYLHHHSPCVVHRDLSARNVLLTSALTAKIADLGNSRIVSIPPGQLAQTKGIPGTLVYMSPEVLDETHHYGPSLDMFSFGHLSLFVATQVFPKNLLHQTYQDPTTKVVKARSELERRKKYITILQNKFGKHHLLCSLIKGCLEYEPTKRLTANEALECLSEIRATISDPYSDLNRLQLEKCLAQKEAEYQRIPLLQSEVEQLTRVQRGLEEECKQKDEVVAAKEQEIAAKERALSDEKKQVGSLTDECAILRQRLQEASDEIKNLRTRPRHLQKNETAEEEESGTVKMLQAQKRELKSQLGKQEEQVASLQEQVALLQEANGSSQSWWEFCKSESSTQSAEENARLRMLLASKDKEIETLSHALNADSRRRQGDLAHKKSTEAQMRATKYFFRHLYLSYAEKLKDKTFPVQKGKIYLNCREYLCALFQRVYDCTYENVLKEIGGKIFQPPNKEVPVEQVSLFLQGYSLLISACELTDIMPDHVKAAVETTVKEDMQVEDDAILCEFITRALPITWGMITTSLPVISSNNVCNLDPDKHEVVAKSCEEAQGVSQWICTRPALYRSLEPYPEQKAIATPKGVDSQTSTKET